MWRRDFHKVFLLSSTLSRGVAVLYSTTTWLTRIALNSVSAAPPQSGNCRSVPANPDDGMRSPLGAFVARSPNS